MTPHAVRDDRGFTLVELMVASMLFGLVMLVVSGIVVSTILTQQTVTTVTSATTDGQLVATTIDQRIRNSSEFKVTNVGTSDQLLVARVAGADATLTWSCYGWYYSAADGGSIRMTTTPAGTKITTPTAAQLAGWTLLLSGVSPRSGSHIFSATGTQLSVAFNATAGDNRPTAIDFTTARLTGVSEVLACY